VQLQLQQQSLWRQRKQQQRLQQEPKLQQQQRVQLQSPLWQSQQAVQQQTGSSSQKRPCARLLSRLGSLTGLAGQLVMTAFLSALGWALYLLLLLLLLLTQPRITKVSSPLLLPLRLPRLCPHGLSAGLQHALCIAWGAVARLSSQQAQLMMTYPGPADLQQQQQQKRMLMHKGLQFGMGRGMGPCTAEQASA
jgi:hypothetical protein